MTGRITKISTIKLITFDVTGTLLKFRKNPVEIYADIGLVHGVTVDIEKLKKSFKFQWKEMNEKYPNYGSSWKDWWTQFVVKALRAGGIDPTTPDPKLNSIAADLIAKFSTSECWEVKDGGVDLLSMLKSNSLKLGVISNFDQRLNRILVETKLIDYFNFALNSHDCRVGKPDPKIFEMALRNCKGVLAGEALHIGDDYKLDYLGAKGAGWQSMLVVPASGQDNVPESVKNSNPSVVFSELNSLNRHLSSLF